MHESKRLKAPETGTESEAKVSAREEVKSFYALSLLREPHGEKLEGFLLEIILSRFKYLEAAT